MRYKLSMLTVALTLGTGTPVLAQQAEWVRQLLVAAQLPIVALDARREGVRNDEVVSVLDAIRRAGIPAYEATSLLDTARVVRRDHGPVDNFGAFVQSQLAAGKRGRELAAAIRAEHARSGKGPGTKVSNPSQGRRDDDDANKAGRAVGTGQGRSDAQRGTAAPGRDESDAARARGRSEAQTGRPATPGKSGNAPNAKDTSRGRGKPNTSNR